MLKSTLLTVLILFTTNIVLNAQLVYHDASSLPLCGKISEQTETRYERLPADLKSVTRPAVWNLGKNTAGLYVRFASASTSVGLKWSLLNNSMMNHMTATGIKGFDLYCLEDHEWVFVNSARPKLDAKDNEATIIENMREGEKEFLLFLPLYDGVTSFQIGIDANTTLLPPKVSTPQTDKTVICYGTSILQGGCATRPGMAHTNILVRWLHTEFINLGFSGNGQLDYEIAETIANKEAVLIILDFMPNVSVQQIEEKLEKFYTIIRKKQPNTPLLFMENPIYPHSHFDKSLAQTLTNKNKALHKVFAKLMGQGDENIRLIPAEGMIGADGEGTVDGTHFTDLGFIRYAEYLYPIIKPYLHN